MLDREEYVEQSYFFRVLGERLARNEPAQEVLRALREEVLSTTKLPLAIDYLSTELKHSGGFAPAMRQMNHYFTPFQAYVVEEAEKEGGQFDLRIALEILRREAEHRAEGATLQAVFLYQFESLCRNRLGYDQGLTAIAGDPIFDEAWKEWILAIRHRIGMVDFADLVYVESQYYHEMQARQGTADGPPRAPLFGSREGRIALAHRRKDPLLLFAALHRQLVYPAVPKPRPVEDDGHLVPILIRRVERLEQRIKLIEEEQRGGIDLQRFYQPPREGES